VRIACGAASLERHRPHDLSRNKRARPTAGIDHATGHCRSFFPWYNTEHRHGGISMLTPHDVHYGQAPAVLAQRQRTLEAAWAAHPERFVRGIPKHSPLPEAVWINPPETSTTGGIAQ